MRHGQGEPRNRWNVIVAGLTTNACVSLTVADLYVREFKIFVPQDCVQALNSADHERALQLMKNSFAANTILSSRLPLSKLRALRKRR